MTWQGVCAVCGGRVKGGADNGTPDVPAGGQRIICLRCLAFGGEGKGEKADAPTLLATFEAR